MEQLQRQTKSVGFWRLALNVVLAVCLLLLWLALTFPSLRTLSPLPGSRVGTKRTTIAPSAEHKAAAIKHLKGLREAVRNQDAPRRMQELFPEGACFTVTLYGLGWTNLINNFYIEEDLRQTAIAEATWALSQYEQPHVVGPFSRTQVRNGVFWLGQRNLVLGQFLKTLPEERRPRPLVEEFHNNCNSLAEAFLASPTGHLDSYPGMCWPADNVTALGSLLLHDELYATDYHKAYEYWLEWTRDNSDPDTGLPAGHLDRRTGRLLQPARGCATSWILGLLPEMDYELASELYGLYQKHFLVTRLGFKMFREYPEGSGWSADVDSGPIFMDAGATATCVGLATCLANGDLETAESICGLAKGFGWQRELDFDDGAGTEYLFGQLPIADAFVAWGFTLPISGPDLTGPRSFMSRLWAKRIILLILLLLLVLTAWQTHRSVRMFRNWREFGHRLR